jgi:hypothetical protein
VWESNPLRNVLQTSAWPSCSRLTAENRGLEPPPLRLIRFRIGPHTSWVCSPSHECAYLLHHNWQASVGNRTQTSRRGPLGNRTLPFRASTGCAFQRTPEDQVGGCTAYKVAPTSQSERNRTSTASPPESHASTTPQTVAYVAPIHLGRTAPTYNRLIPSSGRRDSNPRRPESKSGRLPDCPTPR